MPRLFLVTLLLLARAYGTDPPQEDARMVDLNVVALDSHGAPVTDLTRDDFRITDAGKPETIAFFRHRDNAAKPAPRLAPGEYSNRSAANVPHATLILFDMLNQEFGTRGSTTANLIHDLQSFESADYVYLYILTVNGDLYPVHGLPGAEGEASPPGGEPWTRHIKEIMDKALHDLLQVREPEVIQDIEWRAQMTFRALDVLGADLSRIPGRKSIVWLSDGVPLALGPRRSDTGDYVDFTPLLRQMTETMDRSNVSIYAVRTIMLGSSANINAPDSSGSFSGARGMPRGSAAGTSIYDGSESLATLDTFANLTGGRPDAGKDIGAAVRQALSDVRTSYQIGYYPPAANWDDKFHKLRITCMRKGVRIQAKTGYYAWREPPGAQSTAAVRSALATRFDAAEIGLTARLVPLSTLEAKLEAHIDAHDVVLVHQGDSYHAELRIAFGALIPGAQPALSQLMPFDINFSSQDRDKAFDQGIVVSQTLKLNEDAAAIRLVVIDRSSRAIGSVTVPVPEREQRKPQ
jgi:VWFA-related protein